MQGYETDEIFEQLCSMGRRQFIVSECFTLLGENFVLTLIMLFFPAALINFFLLEDIRFIFFFIAYCLLFPNLMIQYFKKNKGRFKTWNVCGMSKKEIHEKFGRLFLWPACISLFAGLVYYLIENFELLSRRKNTYLTDFFYQFIKEKVVANNSAAFFVFTVFLLLLILVYKKVILEKYFNSYVLLEKNDEKAFLANRIGVNYPLDMNKTVRNNLRIPVELAGIDMKPMRQLIERGLAIGILHNISELKCKDLSDYEIFRVKFARALLVVPQEIYIGREWEKLTEGQQREIGRFILEIQKFWNVKVIYNNW